MCLSVNLVLMLARLMRGIVIYAVGNHAVDADISKSV